MLTPYRDVLARPGALAFSSAGVLARLPISMVGIGMVLAVSGIYGSYGLAGRVSAAYVVVQSICSPLLARLVDRHGQARTMRPATIVAAVAIAGFVVAAALHAAAGWLYALAVVIGASSGSIGALVRARWSYVLDDDRSLHTAYSLESALDELVFIVGPVLATVLATTVSPTAGLVVPIGAMLVGGLLFLGLKATEPPVAPHVDGVTHRSVMRSRSMAVVSAVFVAMGAIFGATDVAVVAFAEEEGNKGVAGVILAVFALGSLLSGLAYGSRHFVRPLWQRFVLGMLALAAGVSLFSLAHSLPVLAAVMFVAGFSIAPTIINGNGLVQQLVPRAQLTEGLTWVGTSLGVGVSFGSSISGALIDLRGSHGGFLVVQAAAALSVVATLLSLRRLRADSRGAEALRRTRPS